MRNVSSAFRRALANGRRDYNYTATITLVANIYSSGTAQVTKNMRYRITGTYSSLSLGGSTVTVGTGGYFTAGSTGTLTVNGGNSTTVIRRVLDITNAQIWSGGFKVEDAVSNDNVFEIGGAIINQGTLVLNNIYETFSEYDFDGASVVMYVGMSDLDNNTTETIKMGTFYVADTKYDGSIITLTCYDYIGLLDKPFSTIVSGGIVMVSASLFTVIDTALSQAGVTLALSSYDFPNKNYVVSLKNLGDAVTCRQIVSWAAQAAGCFARCNVNGEVEIKFYDFAALTSATSGLDGGIFDDGSPSYTSGDTADGGSFNPWNTGYVYDAGSFSSAPNVDIIGSDYSHSIATDDVVITGIRVVERVDSSQISGYANAYSTSTAYQAGDRVIYNNNLYECLTAVSAGTAFDSSKWQQLSVIEYTAGTEGYVISIEGNNLIHGKNGSAFRGQEVANQLATALVGVRFRPGSITHPNDPTIEAGDVGLYFDRKANQYPIIISSTTFTGGDSQKTNSSATAPGRNSAQRYSASTQNYVELRKDMLIEQGFLEDRLANASGLYETYTTNVKTGSGLIRHYHDKQSLAESNIVMMFSDVGFTLTSNYQDTTPTWYGMTVDGQFVATKLSTVGVDADWINSGAITIKTPNNQETFYADTATGTVRIKASEFSLTGGSITSSWSGYGIPTNSNYPASDWTTSTEKAKHLNDVYYDTSGSGIYKYSELHQGILLTISGTYSYSGTGDGAIFAFKYNGYWYTITNPFTNGTIENQTIFLPTTYTYSSQSAFRMRFNAGVVCDLTYKATVVNGVFPMEAVNVGTSAPFTPSYYNALSQNTEYSWTYNVTTNVMITSYLSSTTIDPSAFYGWDSIGVSGEDEYARSLAQQASSDASSASSAVTALDNSLDQQGVFNRLTNNGTAQGIYLSNGQLYILFTYAKGGTLTLGGVNNTNGTLEVVDANSNTIMSIDNSQMYYHDVTTDNILRVTGWGIDVGYRNANADVYVGSVGLDSPAFDSQEDYDDALTIQTKGQNDSIVICDQSYYNSYHVGVFISGSNVYANGNFKVNGSKNRLADTEHYGRRSLYCYETPTPYFGDIGTGITDETGEAIISIDDIFDETVNANVEYSVFLQKEGQGDIWVDEKAHDYFVVKGTPNLKFSWELKAVQKGFEEYRLNDDAIDRAMDYPEDDIEHVLDDDFAEYDRELSQMQEEVI